MRAEQQGVQQKASWRHNAAKLLLITLPLLIMMASVAEIFLRHNHEAWPFQRKMQTFPFMTPEEQVLRWRYSHHGDRNSLGLRGREIGVKEKGSLRILFLGDSLLFQGMTTSGSMHTQVVEDALNRNAALGGVKVEVINAGIPGYTTYQELEFLKIHGLKMKPDVVVLGFVFNDVYPKYIHLPVKPVKGNILTWEPDAYLHRFNTKTFPGRLFARSHLAHTMTYGAAVIWSRTLGRPLFQFEGKLDFYLAWEEHGWADTEDRLGEMHALLRKNNIPLMAVIFPVAEQMEEKSLHIDRAKVLYPQKRMAATLAAINVRSLDLTEPLRAGGGAKLFSDYLHLAPGGNDIVAAQLTRFLTDNRSVWFRVQPPATPSP